MHIITKAFRFEAAHHLTKVPPGHKCGRPHGHSYRIELGLRAVELNEMGFVRDYGEISSIVKPFIDEHLDHRDLNDLMVGALEEGPSEPFETTAENLACFLFNVFQPRIPELCSVTVMETEGTSATYIPPMELEWTIDESSTSTGARNFTIGTDSALAGRVIMVDREEAYKDAWRITGQWIKAHTSALNSVGDISFCIIMVYNKLTRALASPTFRDHYDDAMGYIHLASSIRTSTSVEFVLGELTESVRSASTGDIGSIRIALMHVTESLERLSRGEPS